MIKEFTPPGLHFLVQLPMFGLFHYAQKYVFTSSYSAQNAKIMSPVALEQSKPPILVLFASHLAKN